MIQDPAFACGPWSITEEGLRLEVLGQAESVFALSNGHIGWRGNLDEGEPHGLPGTYLGGFYELRPLAHPEPLSGQPESSQAIVNVTNGKIIRLLVDDEPFDVRYGSVRDHRRILDLRSGTVERTVEWTSPGHRTVRIRSNRLVSFTERAIAAVCYEVEAVDRDMRLVIQSELVANEELPGDRGDPRDGPALGQALVGEKAMKADEGRVLLVHSAKLSGLRLAAVMDHEVLEAPAGYEVHAETYADVGRTSLIANCPAGSKVRLVKYVAYGWSAWHSLPALEDQVAGALLEARQAGFEGLLAEQRQYLDDFWDRADVEVEGDSEVQAAVRYALWQVLQSGARTEKRAIPAKGLTGSGYEGHAFWDTEMYVLPVLTYTVPEAAADALEWRWSTMPAAVARATELGLEGAAFPWRTIHGEECSGYWPASTAAFHINADIADAVMHYVWASGDDDFVERVGLELLVATARLWISLGHYDEESGFRIDGVTGPDEYSALADNNVYTNLMAQRNLAAADELSVRFPKRASELGVTTLECTEWRRAATEMFIPYDTTLGVHPQAEGFTRHARWNFAATDGDRYPLLLNCTYFDLYRKQVVKQADLVMALYVRGDAFSDAEKALNFDYYEALTVRDSSLSACIQSIVAAEVGQLELAYDYLGEAALIDFDDLQRNTADGLHIASLAGAWLGLVAGLGGMRVHGDVGSGARPLMFSPRLPAAITRLSFRLVYRGRRLKVSVVPAAATYELREGEELEIEHYGARVLLRPGHPETLVVPPVVARPAPSQPPGRAPLRRKPVRGVD